MSSSPKPPANVRLNLDRCSNFMRQFRDSETRELTKLSANQFMEVWSHYDKDGNTINHTAAYSSSLPRWHLNVALTRNLAHFPTRYGIRAGM